MGLKALYHWTIQRVSLAIGHDLPDIVGLTHTYGMAANQLQRNIEKESDDE